MKQETHSSLKYVKRFSMCNCLTHYTPETYMAFALTTDFFIKKATPGAKIDAASNEWTRGHKKAFMFPKRIDTFLFSPFNEVFHGGKMYKFGDGVRYTCFSKKSRKAGIKVPRLTPDQVACEVVNLDRKIVKIWGDLVIKILVLYDARNAPPAVLKNMCRYHDAVLDAVPWLVVRINDIQWKKFRMSKNGINVKIPWYHYSEEAKAKMLEQIEQIEDAHGGHGDI